VDLVEEDFFFEGHPLRLEQELLCAFSSRSSRR
jgi:hypothetical protein